MKWLSGIIVAILAATGAWLMVAPLAESCHPEAIAELKQLYPWCAVLFTILLLILYFLALLPAIIYLV